MISEEMSWIKEHYNREACDFLVRYTKEKIEAKEISVSPPFQDGTYIEVTESESDIETYVSKHLDLIEEGLILVGRQKVCRAGVIDLLCEGKNNSLVVIEIKKSKANRNSATQLLTYMGAIKKEQPNKNVRGIIIAESIGNGVSYLNDVLQVNLEPLELNELFKRERIPEITGYLDSDMAAYKTVLTLFESHGFTSDLMNLGIVVWNHLLDTFIHYFCDYKPTSLDQEFKDRFEGV